MIPSHIITKRNESLQNISYISVATDPRNRAFHKVFPILIQYLTNSTFELELKFEIYTACQIKQLKR